MSAFDNFESGVDASSEYNDVYVSLDDESYIDTQHLHRHIGIDLTGDSQNSVGIMHDFDSKIQK